MQENATLDWGELATAAEDIFRVWRSQTRKELDWANTAWIALSRGGLTKYSDELEKTRVLVRFVALGAIFREFCELSRDEIFDTDPSEWADSLEISPIRIGQGLGPDYQRNSEGFLDLESALSDLLDDSRSEIFDALVKAFGNESLLFSSLWRASDGSEIEELEEEDKVILNRIDPSKMRAFEWVTNGMPRLH